MAVAVACLCQWLCQCTGGQIGSCKVVEPEAVPMPVLCLWLCTGGQSGGPKVTEPQAVPMAVPMAVPVVLHTWKDSWRRSYVAQNYAYGNVMRELVSGREQAFPLTRAHIAPPIAVDIVDGYNGLGLLLL